MYRSIRKFHVEASNEKYNVIVAHENTEYTVQTKQENVNEISKYRRIVAIFRAIRAL
jgi:hypothetical protein